MWTGSLFLFFAHFAKIFDKDLEKFLPFYIFIMRYRAVEHFLFLVWSRGAPNGPSAAGFHIFEALSRNNFLNISAAQIHSFPFVYNLWYHQTVPILFPFLNKILFFFLSKLTVSIFRSQEKWQFSPFCTFRSVSFCSQLKKAGGNFSHQSLSPLMMMLINLRKTFEIICPKIRGIKRDDQI